MIPVILYVIYTVYIPLCTIYDYNRFYSAEVVKCHFGIATEVRRYYDALLPPHVVIKTYARPNDVLVDVIYPNEDYDIALAYSEQDCEQWIEKIHSITLQVSNPEFDCRVLGENEESDRGAKVGEEVTFTKTAMLISVGWLVFNTAIVAGFSVYKVSTRRRKIGQILPQPPLREVVISKLPEVVYPSDLRA